MDLSPSKATLQRQKSTTDVWFGRNPGELPYRKLAPLQREIFAAYSGPGDGLCLIKELEKKIQSSDSHSKHKETCGSESWTKKNRKAYGISTSLYDQHPIKKCISGDPIADAFALCARTNNSLLVIADGVNWGEKSMLAARCAVYGAAQYINDQLFEAHPCPVKSTHDAFELLLKAMEHAHSTILRHEGGLTTLCIALVLATRAKSQYAVCIANVGDSLAYVYSKAHGIREITTGSHDISSERDIRDAGGALGPVNGTNPELNNLTCSMTYVDVGDIIFLTTDGISDNYDPVVTKIAVPKQVKPPAPPSSTAAIEANEDFLEENNSKPSSSVSENAVVTVADTVKTANSHSMQGEAGMKESNETTVNKTMDNEVPSKSESSVTGDKCKVNNFENQQASFTDTDFQNGESTKTAIDIKYTNTSGNCRDDSERISAKLSFNHPIQDKNLNVKSEISNFEISAENSQQLNSTPNVDTHHIVNTHAESVTSVQNKNSTSSQPPPMDNDPKIAPSNSGLQLDSSNGEQVKKPTLERSNELSNQLNANIPPLTIHGVNIEPCDPTVTPSSAESQRFDVVKSEHFDGPKTAEIQSQDLKGQKRRSEAYVDKLKSPKTSLKSKHPNENRPKSRTLPVKSVSLDCPKSPDKSTQSKNSTGARKNSSSGNVGTLSPCAEDFNKESFGLGTKDGKPEMFPHERHKYASKEMEKVVLEYELMTEDTVCAQELCGALLHHVLKLTNAKRNVLEDPNLYGKKLKPKERKARDSEIIARMAKAPGKLDHASIVAYEVGCFQGDADENYEHRDRLSDVYGSNDESECESHDGEADHSGEPKAEATPMNAPPISPACDALDIPFIDDSEDSEKEE